MIDEFLLTLSQSKKTQVCLALTLVVPTIILLLGMHMVEGLQFSGPLAPYTEFFRERLLHRYDKGALLVFGLFAGATFKSYRQAYRRLYDKSL
jgi:hypothetical protein